MLRVWAAEMEGQVGVCGHWADLGVPRLSHCRWLAAVAALRLRYFLSHDARGLPPPLPWFAPRPPAELAADLKREMQREIEADRGLRVRHSLLGRKLLQGRRLLQATASKARAKTAKAPGSP